MTRRLTLAERRRRVRAYEWACAQDHCREWRTFMDLLDEERAALARAEKRAKGKKR